MSQRLTTSPGSISPTLFDSVQHPAEDAEILDKVETRWPDFNGNNIPRPAVVAIQRRDGKEVGA